MQFSFPDFPRRIDWAILAAIAVVTSVLGWALGFSGPHSNHLSVVVQFLILLLFVSYVPCRTLFPLPVTVLCLILWAGLAVVTNGYATYVLAATNLPLWDSTFAAADHLFGLDHVALRDFAGSNEFLSNVLVFAYVNTATPLLVVVVLLIARGDIERLANTVSILAISVTATLVLFTIFPAIGAYPYFGMTVEHAPFLAKAPTNSWYAHYAALRDGSMRAFPRDDWKAIVDFPSFHAIYTLIGLYAVAHIRLLAIIYMAFSAVVLVSTLPIGGHYFVDVIAGFIIWAVAIRIVEGQAAWVRWAPAVPAFSADGLSWLYRLTRSPAR